jgi:hypothetical protein
MDRLEIKIGKDEEWDCDTAEIYINGEDLISLVRQFELRFDKNLAGDYMGIDPEDAFLPSTHLLGKPTKLYNQFEKGKVPILECGGCCVPGCWPFLAKITVKDDVVIWSDFEQPHRPEWSYEGFGPFIFDREQYLQALNKRSSIA